MGDDYDIFDEAIAAKMKALADGKSLDQAVTAMRKVLERDSDQEVGSGDTIEGSTE